jgi:hypothetical protein
MMRVLGKGLLLLRLPLAADLLMLFPVFDLAFSRAIACQFAFTALLALLGTTFGLANWAIQS